MQQAATSSKSKLKDNNAEIIKSKGELGGNYEKFDEKVHNFTDNNDITRLDCDPTLIRQKYLQIIISVSMKRIIYLKMINPQALLLPKVYKPDVSLYSL